MDDIKGTGAKPQNADCVILVERTADRRQIKLQSFSKDSDENIRILLNVSARDSKEPKFTYAGELKESGSHCQRRGQLNESRILAAMKSGNSLASSNIAKTTGLSDATVRRSLTALVEAGSVQKDGTGRWTKYKAINQSEDNCA
jgi:Fic family protein